MPSHSILAHALIVLLLTADAASAQSTRPSPQANPTTRPAPTKCPYGHASLKRADVAYGLLIMTPALQRAIDNSDVVQGGCVFAPGISPAYLLLCTQCNARFDPVMRKWERSAKTPKEFYPPLAPQIATFPLPETKQQEPPQFTQRFRDGKVISESLTYWTREPEKQVRDRVEQTLNAWAVKAARTDRDLDDRRIATYQFILNGRDAELRVLHQNDGYVHVALDYPTESTLPLHEWDRSAAVKD